MSGLRSCFFFFKQKTAYEMRISDWSSDVCSSDLLRKRLNEVAAIDFFGAHGRQAAQAAITEADRRSHQHPDVSGPGAPELTPAALKRRAWVTRRHVHVDRIASAWLLRRFIAPAIGRASCRERECLYV